MHIIRLPITYHDQTNCQKNTSLNYVYSQGNILMGLLNSWFSMFFLQLIPLQELILANKSAHNTKVADGSVKTSIDIHVIVDLRLAEVKAKLL